MIAYKLLRKKKDGLLYPLFINKKVSTPLNTWMAAEYFPTAGFAPRQGWHCCLRPYAPHLKLHLKSGEERIWVKCEVEDYTTYNRPESQGGKWVLAQNIKLLSVLSDNEVVNILWQQ